MPHTGIKEGLEEYVPAGHKVHTDEPVRRTEPMAQAVHAMVLVEPAGEEVPAAQGVHTEPPPPNVPAGQMVHEDEPAVEE